MPWTAKVSSRLPLSLSCADAANRTAKGDQIFVEDLALSDEIILNDTPSDIKTVDGVNLPNAQTSIHQSPKKAILGRLTTQPSTKTPRRLYSREEPTYEDLEEALGQRQPL